MDDVPDPLDQRQEAEVGETLRVMLSPGHIIPPVEGRMVGLGGFGKTVTPRAMLAEVHPFASVTMQE